MRRPVPQNEARTKTDIPLSLPLKGMELRSQIDALPPGHALDMVNCLPIGGEVQVRKGYELLAAVSPSADPSLIPYDLQGFRQLLAVADGELRVVGGPLLNTHTGPDRFSYATLSNYLIMVNGQQHYLWEGTTLSVPAMSGDLPPSPFVGVCSHNERAFYWCEDSLDFWHGAGSEIQGNLTRFPLSNLGNIRGHIVTIASWTVDASHGQNDILVIITSEGDVVLYEGVDPTDAADWRQTGRYKTTPPIDGGRITLNYASDLLILTQSGVASLYAIMQKAEAAMAVNFSAQVDPDLLELTDDAEPLFWDMIMDPRGRFILINTPGDASGIWQYAYGLANKAFARFTGIEAATWCALGGELYFITMAGEVCRFWASDTDNGAEIAARVDLLSQSAEREQSVAQIALGLKVTDGVVPIRATVETAPIHEPTLKATSSLSFAAALTGYQLSRAPAAGRGNVVSITLTIQNGGRAVAWKTLSGRAAQSRRKL